MTPKEVVERLDEWSGNLPNGEHKDILVAAADLIDEQQARLNAAQLDHTADFFTLKVK